MRLKLNRPRRNIACAACVTVALAITACSGAPGKTSFAVTLVSGRTAVTSIQLVSGKCVLLSDATTQPTYAPEDYYRCSGAHPLSNGQNVEWECETRDGRTFTQITIDAKSYDLANGRLFVFSVEDGERKLLQLDRDLSKVKITALSDLATDDPEIRAFLGKSSESPDK